MRVLATALFLAGAAAQTKIPLCIDFKVGAKPSAVTDTIVGDKIKFHKSPGDSMVAFTSEGDFNSCNMAKAINIPNSDGPLFEAELDKSGKLLLASKTGCSRGTKLFLATEDCGAHGHNPRCKGAEGWHSAASHSADPNFVEEDVQITHRYLCPDETETAATTRVSDCPACPEPECPTASQAAATAPPSQPKHGGAIKKLKTAATLVWTPPSENFVYGTDTFELHMQVAKLENTKQVVELDDPTSSSAVVKGLKPNKLYHFTVIAKNGAGSSEPLKFPVKTMGGGGKKGGKGKKQG